MIDISESVQGIQSTTPRRKTSFARDALKLVSGSMVAQIVGMLITPILTRMYAPEAFGPLAVFTSITTILGVIVCMRYELAIMLPQSDEEAANLLGLSVGFAGLVALVSLGVFWWGRDTLSRWLNAPELLPYLWLVAPVILALGIFTALNYWSSRTRRFGELSIARMLRPVTTHVIELGVGYGGAASSGSLIAAYIAGWIVAGGVLAGQVCRNNWKLFWRSIRWPDVKTALYRYRKFPLYSVGSALLSSVSWQLPVLMLSTFFSSTIVGYYSLGFRILQAPMNLIGSAISLVFFQRAAEAKAQGTLATIVEKALRWLVITSLFPMLMLTIIGRDFYALVFGQNWAEAGVYTQILSIWAFFWFTVSPLSALFSVLEKQEFDLKLNIVLIITRFLALAIGGFFSNARLALLLFAVSGTFVYGYQTLAVMKYCGISRLQALKIYLSRLLSFLPYGAVMLVAYIMKLDVWMKMVIAGLLSAWYLWRVATTEANVNRLLKSFLRRTRG